MLLAVNPFNHLIDGLGREARCGKAKVKALAAVSRVKLKGKAPSSGVRACVFLKPTRPVSAAGMRIEPPPSLAWAIGTTPAATAAALPPDDPPGEKSGFHGLRVVPSSGLSVMSVWANSGVVVLPTTIAPARRKDADARAELLNAADAVILCLPDDAARSPGGGVRHMEQTHVPTQATDRVVRRTVKA